MGIRFKVNSDQLNDALSVVRVVEPPVDKAGQAGFLFVIRGEKGYVYSRDSQHVSKAEFDISDVEGEGPFVYPSSHINQLSLLKDKTVAFEYSNDDGQFVVKYKVVGGKAWFDRPTFDPKLLQTCDKDLTDAKEDRTFSAAILKEALSLSKAFTDTKDARAEDKDRTVHIFDKDVEVDDPKNPGQKIRPGEKGDGTLFASNGKQVIYFYTDAFLSKHLSVHPTHLSSLQSFLSKATGDVTVKTTRNMTFAIDQAGRAFGWAHSNASSTPQKYSYYSLTSDTHVLTLIRGAVLQELKSVAAGLDKDRHKVKITYSPESQELQFEVAEGLGKGASESVLAVPDEETKGKNEPFTVNVNVHHFMDLFEGCKSHQVMLRVRVIPANDKIPKGQAMFRTLDSFYLDQNGKVVGGEGAKVPEGAVPCRVTRFTPSML